MLNEDLVEHGYAVPLAIAPDTRYAERLEEAAEHARASGRGLWDACTSPPKLKR